MTTMNTRRRHEACAHYLGTYRGWIEGGRVVSWVYIIAPAQEPT